MSEPVGAVYPSYSTGELVHLYVPGYVNPHGTPRHHMSEAPLCNGGTIKGGPSARGAVMTTLALSLVPAEVVSANGRLHWARKARMVAHLRQRAAMTWRLAGSPHIARARCVVHVTYPDKRARDCANLSPTIKACIDGLVHPFVGCVGILPDDDDGHLVGPDLRPDGVTPGRFTFTFEFEELTP